ncbi:MAG: OmpA family protein [Deltaproteobacteria bacterium]|nr:OmpA family protein [Deltaproteobacteria bacterium]
MKSWPFVPLTAVLLLASLASAAENPRRNAFTFRPTPHAGDVFGVHAATAPKAGHITGGAWFVFNDKPLKVSDVASGAEVRLVSRQIVSEFYAAMGLFDRLSVGLNLPVFLSSMGDKLPAELRLRQPDGSSLGDARVSARFVVQDGKGQGLGLALAEDVGLPTATADHFSGDEGVTSETRVVADMPVGPLQVAVNVGFAARKAVTVLGRSYGNQWLMGASGQLNLMCGKLDVVGSLEGRTAGGSPFGNYQDGQLDGLGGARVRFGDLAVTAAAGGGLVQGFGAPAFRATLGLGWLPNDPALCNPDLDGDGVGKTEDRCPTEKGTAALGGCPDSDGDGIANPDDKCPAQSGLALYGGCTATDGDGDGVVDHEDRCKAESGPKDLGGCPDSDADGLPDLDDKCPKDKGDKAQGGCPPDTDGDGLFDTVDKCPDVAGPKERKGCPEQRVVVTKQKIAITEKVYFETGEAKIKKESLGLLDEVAGILKKNPDLKKVRIEGHTDNIGDPAANLKLSADRAASVRKYLIGKGVAGARLEAQGLGDTKPLADNATEEGKHQNRRVEFHIVERTE